MKTPGTDDKASGAGVYSPLPAYPGLPSRTRRTTVVVVPKKKRSKKPEEQPAEPAPSQPETKGA